MIQDQAIHNNRILKNKQETSQNKEREMGKVRIKLPSANNALY